MAMYKKTTKLCYKGMINLNKHNYFPGPNTLGMLYKAPELPLDNSADIRAARFLGYGIIILHPRKLLTQHNVMPTHCKVS